MIDLYFAPTPNDHKITLFLEEAELDYRLIKIGLGKSGRFHPRFLHVSPNNRTPAVVGHSPADGGEPLSLFKSDAILLYLAKKTGLFLGHGTCEHAATLQWLFWQVGRLGPMLEQNHHFNHVAPRAIPYAVERYQAEAQRLYHVLNRRLENSPQLGDGDYSTTDIACWPWINAWTHQRIGLTMYPAVGNWHGRTRSRPAVGQALLKAQLGDERLNS